jgi:hypothetical protein
MSKKSNVHPDYYKTAGRDRPDDAARARLNRAIAAKGISQQRPDRMAKGFYFEHPEPATAEAPARPAKKAGTKKPATGKTAAARRTPTPRKAASGRGKTGRAAKPVAKKK